MYIYSGQAGWNRNFYSHVTNGEIVIKENHSHNSPGKKEKYTVCAGELIESMEQNHNRKTHTVFGEFRKTYYIRSQREYDEEKARWVRD